MSKNIDFIRKNKMKYSDEFIKKVKGVYPHYTDLHECLDNGSELVGRYLDDSCSDCIPTNILEEIETVGELKSTIALYKERVNLYKEWYNFTRN